MDEYEAFALQLYNEAFAFGKMYGLKQDREGINERINSLKKALSQKQSKDYKGFIKAFGIEKLDEKAKFEIIQGMLKLMESAYISGFDKGFKETRQKVRG